MKTLSIYLKPWSWKDPNEEKNDTQKIDSVLVMIYKNYICEAIDI